MTCSAMLKTQKDEYEDGNANVQPSPVALPDSR